MRILLVLLVWIAVIVPGVTAGNPVICQDATPTPEPTTPEPTTLVPGTCYNMQEDVTYHSDTFVQLYTSYPSECCMACWSKRGCRAYSYALITGVSCTLHYSNVTKVPLLGARAIAGLIAAPQSCSVLPPDTVYRGDEVLLKQVETAEVAVLHVEVYPCVWHTMSIPVPTNVGWYQRSKVLRRVWVGCRGCTIVDGHNGQRLDVWYSHTTCRTMYVGHSLD